MNGDLDEDEDPNFEPDCGYGPCSRCDGEGFILVCPDDVSHGAGECMHGDGEIVCPECKGGDL